MVTKKVHLTGTEEALRLFGQHDQNLRALERAYNVQIFGRGDVMSIRGGAAKVEQALAAVDEMRGRLGADPNVNTDTKGSDPIPAAAYTNALGVITPGFMLDPGPYAVWRQRGGDTFINPQLVTVTP